MEISALVEPGISSIRAVADTSSSNTLRCFFEICVNEEAYKAHIDSPHSKKYFETTRLMISSRKLIETVPVQLSSKMK